MKVHHQMLQSFLCTGYAPNRWKKCVSCCIKKYPRNPKISRLRIVHLYEHDSNLMTKVLWGRKMIRHAEAHNALGDDQYGLRPRKACIDVVLRKMLTYNYARQMQTEMATLDNDATSCFNLQLPNFSTIICRKFGMPVEACKLFADTLEDMRYHIKTSNGVSDKCYFNAADHHVYGTG